MTSAPYKHQDCDVWVQFHSEDNLVAFPSCFLTDPKNHKPEIDPLTGKIDQWGIPFFRLFKELPESPMLQPPKLARRAQNEKLYKSSPTPEAQWIKVLAEKKQTHLNALNLDEIKLRQKQDYILKIVFDDVKDKKGEKFVWRVVKVSGGMKLSNFVDKVALPAMGWARNYHAYTVVDRSDGALFGPKNGAYSDMEFLGMRGCEFLDDEEYTLAHLLVDGKSEIGLNYDLLSYWRHSISIDKIIPCEESNGNIELLAGSGACPPEDGNAPMPWQQTYKALMRHPLVDLSGYMDAQHLCHGSLNYKDSFGAFNDRSQLFRPHEFDLAHAQKRLQNAVASRPSNKLKPTRFTKDDCCGGAEHVAHARMLGHLQTGPNIHGQGTDVASFVPQVFAGGMCGNCGKQASNEVKLLRCSRCRGTWYCGATCQKGHWKQHKRTCVAPAPVASVE